MRAPFSAALSGATLTSEYRTLAASLARVSPTDEPFDFRAYDPRSIARARAHWAGRMVDEYTSTAVFGALASQLMEANAPLDTAAVALRMGQDELIHAEACARILALLGTSSVRERELELTPIARHPGVSARERALRNVIFATSLSEMNSVAYFVSSLETMTDPFLRGMTRQLLADEVLHGSFGFHFLEARRDWLDEDVSMRASLGRYLRYGFAVAERELTRGSEVPVAAGDDDDALGLVHPKELCIIYQRTMAEAVVPGLERFGIPAEEAWRLRSLAA